MRKKRQPRSTRGHPEKTDSSLRILRVFIVIVLLAIVSSLGFRLFTLVNESQFHASHDFTVAFIHKKDVDLVVVHPQLKAVSHLEVRGADNLADARREVGFIEDAVVTLDRPFSDPDKLSRYFFQAAFHREGTQSSLSIYDLIRLGISTRGTTQATLDSEAIRIPTGDPATEKIIEELFYDQSLVDESISIGIINASDTPGLGSYLERVLTNLGASVLTVKNGDPRTSSVITYTGDKSYTVTRIGKLLHIPVEKSSMSGLSDIIITIGKDKKF